MRNRLLSIIIIMIGFFAISNCIIAQEKSSMPGDKETQFYKDFDYFNYEYRYLDSNYNITISPEDFEKIIKKYKLNRGVLGDNYKDSLVIVMYGEFDDGVLVRYAINRIGFSLLRASYYLWCSVEEVQDLVDYYHYNHPYLLFDYVWNNEEKWDSHMKSFVKKLKEEVMATTGNTEISEMQNKEFFSFALVNNPQRQEDFSKIQAGEGVGCGKPDCCQTEGSTKEKCEK